MAMLNWARTTKKRIVLCLNPTMKNSRLGFRVFDERARTWRLIEDRTLISDRFCANGSDNGMRVEISTFVGTDNTILFAHTITNRVIGRLDLAASGSIIIYSDMNVELTDILDHLPTRLTHKVAVVIGVQGIVNISIIDLINGYDEDILRYKNTEKGIFVPNKYISATPPVDQSEKL